ncbi:hypothetical protein GPJ81_16640 [Pseudomonas alkylphenolica]|uniref:Delta-60 repeat domain-containing protein n=1 Tax=Pseudomonas alkylphenolica TaxID=237609 RepID=A0A6I6GUN2_9PSED|nr:hypothetical protein [Pseudomonas alkylphenolica]QGW78243.1 hypothetical protein GPJ81_16640 [Pseudomonas alkylphenolica]
MTNSERISALLDPNYGDRGVAHPDDSLFQISASIQFGSDRLCIGQAKLGSGWGYALLRVDNSGKLDEQFGTKGITVGSFKEGTNSTGQNLHVLADGRIIVMGSYYNESTAAYYPAMARFNASGNLDKSFGHEGHVVIELPPPPSSGQKQQSAKHESTNNPRQSSALASNELYVTYRYPFSHSVLLKFNIDGEPDEEFNNVGYKYLTAPSALETGISGILINDKKIYLSGSAYTGETSNPCIICLKSTGAEDPQFGKNGYLITDLGANVRLASLAVLDDQGNIVCAGDDSLAKGLIIAFTPLGSNLPGFVISKTEFGGSGGQWTEVQVDTSRKHIIAVGTTLGGDEADVVVGRYGINGTPDKAFGENEGWARIALGDSIDLALTASLESDGKTLIAGSDFESSNGRIGFMLRCLTDQ